MCGIIGIIGNQPVANTILESLKRLEYRGYDSSGIATINNSLVEVRKAQGKLVNLDNILKTSPIDGNVGIGHTRWATHGEPSEINAHPHSTDKVAVVHNGIIENFNDIKKELSKEGIIFTSQTDTEVIPRLITYYLDKGSNPKQAVELSLKRLEGAFAIGVIFASNPEILICARRGSPLAIGYGKGAMYIGSDAIALAPLAKDICYLEEDDMAVLNADGAEIYDKDGNKVEREIKSTNLTGAAIGKGNYRHYMLKEIFEQPTIVGEILNIYGSNGVIGLPELPFNLADIKDITLIACGTSFYAAQAAGYLIEKIAKVRVSIDIASEYRYRTPIFSDGGLVITISQSGETADTLAAMRYAKENNQHTLAIVNVPESSMDNEADASLYTYAGPEIGVASTKAFTAQLTTLACLVIALAEANGSIKNDEASKLCHYMAEVPARISEILHDISDIEDIANYLSNKENMLYIGRGTSYAIAYEAALKMKEISYIHAEAYAAGEMKHGPIALIDEDMPVVAIAPSDELFDKTASNIREAAARGAKIILISDKKGSKNLADITYKNIILPEVKSFVSPILYAIPAQLLSYYTAVLKGTDVDQPRNLAKSVTVE